MASKRKKSNAELNRSSIIRVVTGIWAINIVAGMIPALDYEPKESINGIFMAIVGTLFMADRAKSNKQENTEEKTTTE